MISLQSDFVDANIRVPKIFTLIDMDIVSTQNMWKSTPNRNLGLNQLLTISKLTSKIFPFLHVLAFYVFRSYKVYCFIKGNIKENILELN